MDNCFCNEVQDMVRSFALQRSQPGQHRQEYWSSPLFHIIKSVLIFSHQGSQLLKQLLWKTSLLKSQLHVHFCYYQPNSWICSEVKWSNCSLLFVCARGGRIYCRVQFPARETGSVPGEPQVRAGPRREDIPPDCGARTQGQPLITQHFSTIYVPYHYK